MTSEVAIITLQANVIFACEKAGFDKATVRMVEDALDLAISALERDRWISVEEPPNMGWYLVICNQWGGRIHRLAFCRDGIWTEWTDKGYDITEHVTHYRPLPEPPKEET